MINGRGGEDYISGNEGADVMSGGPGVRDGQTPGGGGTGATVFARTGADFPARVSYTHMGKRLVRRGQSDGVFAWKAPSCCWERSSIIDTG